MSIALEAPPRLQRRSEGRISPGWYSSRITPPPPNGDVISIVSAYKHLTPTEKRTWKETRYRQVVMTSSQFSGLPYNGVLN